MADLALIQIKLLILKLLEIKTSFENTSQHIIIYF